MLTTRPRRDLEDVLSDALDEFEAQNADLGSLVRDLGGTIDELSSVADSELIEGLRSQWRIVADADEQRRTLGDRVALGTQANEIEVAIKSLRDQLAR